MTEKKYDFSKFVEITFTKGGSFAGLFDVWKTYAVLQARQEWPTNEGPWHAYHNHQGEFLLLTLHALLQNLWRSLKKPRSQTEQGNSVWLLVAEFKNVIWTQILGKLLGSQGDFYPWWHNFLISRIVASGISNQNTKFNNSFWKTFCL